MRKPQISIWMAQTAEAGLVAHNMQNLIPNATGVVSEANDGPQMEKLTILDVILTGDF